MLQCMLNILFNQVAHRIAQLIDCRQCNFTRNTLCKLDRIFSIVKCFLQYLILF